MMMNALKTIRDGAVGLGLVLLGVSVTHAQGSTDIYTTNFQQVYPSEQVKQAATAAPIAAGSTDIYTTNFQRAFPSATRPVHMAEVQTGSTDIYRTDFQKVYM
jgi:hypothetical protein